MAARAVTLTADVTVRAGTFVLRCSVDARAGRTTALLGPNGAGKTMLLRALCGVTPLAGGRIVLDDAVLDDVGAGSRVPPERRRMGVVFQEAMLFPHLSALDNVAFGPRSRGLRRGVAMARARTWLERVGMGGVASHRPVTLSGGERQRVALARALATEPRVLLLDEPLTAVDAPARLELRRLLRDHLDSFGGPRIIVTHDPVDASALADDVVVMEHGGVTQRGTFMEVTAHPRSEWVARIAGVNLVRGTCRGSTLTTESGATLLLAVASEGSVLATIHPRAVALFRDRPAGSPRNLLEGRITDADVQGDRWRISVDGPIPLVAEVTSAAAAELRLAEGGAVYASVKATEIELTPV